MGVYTYLATDGTAAVVEGTLIADTPREARNRLRDQGLSIHEIKTDASEDSSIRDSQGDRAVGSNLLGVLAKWLHRKPDSSGFLRELATLLEVGSPMLEALDTAIRTRRGSFQRVLLKLRERVAAGSSLAHAMRDSRLHGRLVFDDITVAMTQVGEDAGGLGDVLNQVASYEERGQQFKNRLASALAYPALVMLTGVGVSVFLMTYVVPGLLESLTEAGQDLPWITHIVKRISDLLVGYGWIFGLAVLLMLFVFVGILRVPQGRYRIHQLILQLPGVGDIVRKQAVVRLSFVLSTLMRSGVGFEQAIGIAQRSTRNLVLREALKNCERAVHEGRDLGPALEQAGTKGQGFPETVVQVFTLGQASGRLEDMLDRLAESFDRQVSTLTSRLTSLIEPILILALAVVVGAIAFATILPILEIGNAL